MVIEIIDELAEVYIVKSNDGLIRELDKSLILDNGFVIKNNKIDISNSLDDSWFDALRTERKNKHGEAEAKLFFENFGMLLWSKELILSDPRYFFIYPRKAIFIGMAYCGLHHICLGGLLESYENSNNLKVWSQEHKSNIYIVSATGSPLSGRHSYKGWCESLNSFVTVDGKGSFSPIIKEMTDIANLYKNKSPKNIATIAELIEKLKS